MLSASAPSGAELLSVSNLRVELPAGRALQPVIHDVSFTIRPGEAVGLVGESGAGKSMTARAIARLLPAGASVGGGITFDGRSVLSMGPADLRRYRSQGVAMIFQDPRAHTNPVRRIGDFLTEALRTVLGVREPEARRRAVAMLAEVGIDDGERRMRQYPHELSGGMLQRVMIAAALLAGPRLLLADEPTTALDVTTQGEVMAILDEQRRERGLAMLFVTHDLDLAAAVCDRTCVMYAGSIVEEQASTALNDGPLHPYTAALLAARPRMDMSSERRPRSPAGRGRRSRRHMGVRSPTGVRTARSRASPTSRSCGPSAAAWCGVGDQTRSVVPSPHRANGREPVAENVLEAEQVRKVFRLRGRAARGHEIVAVADVSFTVARGESLAVVGESGSGKTTLARMLVGLERPTSGRITVAGTDRTAPARRAAERRRRGRETQIVFQDPYSSLDPRQTPASSIDEVLQLHFDLTRAARTARVHELAAQVGLDERHMAALPRALSGGQRQRVAIARALAAEPEVLVLDEAVASLDVSIQAQILNLLADIRPATGISYIVISHDLAVVRQVTDTTVVMQRGSAVEQGPTAQILEHPEHPYTQLLRRSVPGPGWKPARRGATARTAEDAEPDGKAEENG